MNTDEHPSEQLRRSGFADFDRHGMYPEAGEDRSKLFKKILDLGSKTRNKSTINKDRVSIWLPFSKFKAKEIQMILTPYVLQTVASYFGCKREPVLFKSLQILKVLKGARCQPYHRDHHMGNRKHVIVAMSLDSTRPLGTYVVPGSHTEQEIEPMCQGRVAQEQGWLRDGLPCNSRFFAFDAFTVHRGSSVYVENSDDSHRIFCHFISPKNTSKENMEVVHQQMIPPIIVNKSLISTRRRKDEDEEYVP
jgi:hypothetical protein